MANETKPSRSESWRNDKTSAQRGYGYKWQQSREIFLTNNPLCAMCKNEGRVTMATVIDHIFPHKGDLKLFWRRSNWQGLCKWHHDSVKQRMEKGTLAHAIGIDGFPDGWG
jgi:5-methylcytosine-specific restriction endonuclease McrA